MIEKSETPKLRIMYLEDDPTDVELVRGTLEAHNIYCDVVQVESSDDFIAAISNEKFNLIFADQVLPSYDGLSALEAARQICPEVPFILISGKLGEEFAIECLQRGATDYVLKQRMSRLVPAVRRALHEVKEHEELQQAEESLRIMQRALNAASNGIVITDALNPEHPIIYHNPAFEQMTGYSHKEILGRNCRFLQNDDRDQEGLEKIRTAIEKARKCRVILRNYRKDGTLFWNELTISPVLDESGKVTHFIGIQNDISERKHLEEQLLHSQKMEAMGRLAGGIAHDFNNLLTAITAYSEFLLDEIEPDEAAYQDVIEIIKATERATLLTRQLLAFSRKQPLQSQLLNLNQVIEDLLQMVKRIIKVDIQLETNLAPDLHFIMNDPAQIQQILMNLCINAQDAMPEGGKLILKTKNIKSKKIKNPADSKTTTRDYVRLQITDTGAGMNPEIKEQIFEPFFTTKVADKGTGLGLAVVYGIVEQHKGFIEVESEEGKGTTFYIYFPAIHGEKTKMVKDSKSPQICKGKGTILVVEDEQSVRNVMIRILKQLGYHVQVANDGVEAIANFEADRETIDLVILDVVMPKLSGPQVFSRLNSIKPNIPALFVTGYDYSGELDKLMKQYPGQITMLQKPFSKENLSEATQKLLDH